MTNVVVTDNLPPGMRYQPGSARLDAATPLEPEIGADGLTLTFRLPELAAQTQRDAALRRRRRNRRDRAARSSIARSRGADDGSESNTASAAVLLREELFSSAALLLGRVLAGTCGTTVDSGEGVGACAFTSRTAAMRSPTRKASTTSKE